jgi:hypothetical protein
VKHLSRDQIVDLVDGTADSAVTAHVRECDGCRLEWEQCRSAIEAARLDEVPEPSPLFWDHFSARVSDAVRQEAAASPRTGWRRFGLRFWLPASSMAALVIAAGLGAAVWQRTSPLAPAQQVDVPTAVVDVAPAADLGLGEPASGGEASWQLLTDVSEDVSVDAGSGTLLPARPGSADQALHQLTDAERRELIRLLNAEMAAGSIPAPTPAAE